MDSWRGTLWSAMALIALGSCGTLKPETGSAVTGTAHTATADKPGLQPSDFILTVKVTRKKCFGDAGCNVSYRIDLSTTFKLKPGLRFLVTYEVVGMRDGPEVDNFTITGDTFSGANEEYAETASSR